MTKRLFSALSFVVNTFLSEVFYISRCLDNAFLGNCAEIYVVKSERVE